MSIILSILPVCTFSHDSVPCPHQTNKQTNTPCYSFYLFQPDFNILLIAGEQTFIYFGNMMIKRNISVLNCVFLLPCYEKVLQHLVTALVLFLE